MADAKQHFPLLGTPLCGSKSFSALLTCKGCCLRCENRLEALAELLRSAARGENVESKAKQMCQKLGISLNDEEQE